MRVIMFNDCYMLKESYKYILNIDNLMLEIKQYIKYECI